MSESPSLSYAGAGVVAAGKPLAGLLSWVNRTLSFRQGNGEPVLGIGHYANVLRIGENLGLAISTDSVGTKVLVAEMLGKYDTIGIDCVAMNVNDVLCVGAEPISMVDYLAVEVLDPAIMAEIAKGLAVGAEIANVTIPGGETAQLPDTVHGTQPGLGFDLVGTCVGQVDLDRIIAGANIQPGDVIVGLASSGIHSNGLTLARKTLLDTAHLKIAEYSEHLGARVGET